MQDALPHEWQGIFLFSSLKNFLNPIAKLLKMA